MACYADWTRQRTKPLCPPLSHPSHKRVQLALAPLYLGSFYARLDECIGNIVPVVGHCDEVTRADSSFLLSIPLERFPSFPPKPIGFPIVVMEEITLADGSKGTRAPHTHEPRA